MMQLMMDKAGEKAVSEYLYVIGTKLVDIFPNIISLPSPHALST